MEKNRCFAGAARRSPLHSLVRAGIIPFEFIILHEMHAKPRNDYLSSRTSLRLIELACIESAGNRLRRPL